MAEDMRQTARTGKSVMAEEIPHPHDAMVHAVLSDLENYCDIVTPGSYVIVEDGVRDLLSGQTGPMLAVERFLSTTDRFEIDASRERFLLTYNPKGFLKCLR